MRAEVRSCCGCLCQTDSSEGCGGAKLHVLEGQNCSEVCAQYCEGKRCNLKSSNVLNTGECPGGLLPF